jgi:hypothetical protein
MDADLLRATRHGVGGRLFVALWGGLAVVDLTRPGAGEVVSGIAVVALVGLCGIGQSPAAAAAIAATGWLVINGFVQHRYGELGFGAASWWLLVTVLVVVLTVSSRTTRQRGLR